MGKVYGYCRISRATQNIERQIRNIKNLYEDVVIYQEAFTGTKREGRTQWNRLMKTVEAGDTILFDSVSRMSRNAEEGVKMYLELYNRGVELIFLKEPYINTSVYSENIKRKIELVGTEEDVIFEGINQYFVKLAERQIRIAFEQAEKEVVDLHQRTKEGMETARQKGKQIGQRQGAVLQVKKKGPIKQEMLKKSKDFHGNLTDVDLIKVLGIAKNTYYKYKRELKAESSDFHENKKKEREKESKSFS